MAHWSQRTIQQLSSHFHFPATKSKRRQENDQRATQNFKLEKQYGRIIFFFLEILQTSALGK